MDNDLDLKNPLSWIAVGFGAGLSPIAPGTIASFFAALFYFFVIDLFSEISLFFLIYLFFILLTYFFGILIYKKIIGSENDPRHFVWDEYVGMWIACFPISLSTSTTKSLLIAFFLFRLFDIWKPGIISKLDEVEGAFGVMIDDVLAGIFSCIILYLCIYFNVV